MSSFEKLRHIALTGAPNFRDYGGYTATDGRTVKWRQLFRSGQLSALTRQDVAVFEGLDIQLVFDFRREQECERDPNILPDNNPPRVVGLPIVSGSALSFFEQIANGNLDSDSMTRFMCAINREFVLEQGAVFREMFRCLLQKNSGGSLVHCAAGKDRTGFAVAMLLSALGVPRNIILKDYLLTAERINIDYEIKRIKKKYQWDGEDSAIRPMLEVRELYLQSAFDAIDAEFSSVETYLQSVLGVGVRERELLQARYLE